jgi:DNA-binding XRE family transcriptional regulator
MVLVLGLVKRKSNRTVIFMWDNSDFLARLYAITRAVSKSDLATHIGVNKQKITDYGFGRYRPTVEVLRKIKEKTGEDLSDLVPRTRAETFGDMVPRVHNDGVPRQHRKWLSAVERILNSGNQGAISGLQSSVKLCLSFLDHDEVSASAEAKAQKDRRRPKAE